MKTSVSLALLLALLSSAFAAVGLPPGVKPALVGARHEVREFSVAVPGKGWVETRTETGVVFVKRIDPVESCHAGLAVTPVPPAADRAAFAAQARAAMERPSNPRYRVLKNETVAADRPGYWGVRCRIAFEDSGAVNVGSHGSLLTYGMHLLLLDPAAPDRLVAVWFSWRGVRGDERKFAAEAEAFLASFQAPPPSRR